MLIQDLLWAKDLLNNRMAYVAVSRGAYDAQLFTNDREKLGYDVSRSSAHEPARTQEQVITPQWEIAPQQEQSLDFGLGLLSKSGGVPARVILTAKGMSSVTQYNLATVHARRVHSNRLKLA